MALHPQSIQPIPRLTKEIAQQAFPKGNLYMTLRDELGIFYNDSDFAQLYSLEGQPALRPWHLALVCLIVATRHHNHSDPKSRRFWTHII